MNSMATIPEAEIWEQLKRILSSHDFSGTERQMRLLTYIVQATLAYNNEALNVKNIAMQVFEQNADFDTRNNPMVRSEVANLRLKLERYYAAHMTDPVLISVPKGGYVATFARQLLKEEAETAFWAKDQAPEGGEAQPNSLPNYDRTVCILPFSIVGEAQAAEGLVIGLLNEVSINLTKSYDVQVIDHNFPLQQASYVLGEDPKKLEEERGNARFIFSGRVQLSGDLFKIWIMLRDNKSGVNVWSDKYEGNLHDKPTFYWQEEIAEAIVCKVAGEFGVVSRVRYSEYAAGLVTTPLGEEAFLLYGKWASKMTDETLERARAAAEKAAATYPESSTLQAILADLYFSSYEYGKPGSEAYLEKAYQITVQTIAQDPNCQLAHMSMAFYHCICNDIDRFLFSAQRAIAINPSNANVLVSLVGCYGMVGMWDIALEYLEKAKALNPACLSWGSVLFYARYHYFHQNYEAAYAEALRINPAEVIWNPLIRLLSSGMLNRKAQARAALDDLLKAYPNFREKGNIILSRLTSDKNLHAMLCQGIDKANELLGEKICNP